MKFMVKLALIAGISALLQLFLPFWSVAIVAFLVCLGFGGNGFSSFFFFNDTATTEIYTLSLHDALPIYHHVARANYVSYLPQK